MIIKQLVSETSLARESVAHFCTGNGVDLGFGGDPITPWSICIDRPEGAPNRAHFNRGVTHLSGDIFDLHWFKDRVLDYVYSSHAIEDADDTLKVMLEWLRVLKPGGMLIICAPDQKAYVQFCAEFGDTPNGEHKHADFGLDYMRKIVAGMVPLCRIVHELYPVPYSPYSFELVLRKHAP